jgi:hypothetical protein
VEIAVKLAFIFEFADRLVQVIEIILIQCLLLLLHLWVLNILLSLLGFLRRLLPWFLVTTCEHYRLFFIQEVKGKQRGVLVLRSFLSLLWLVDFLILNLDLLDFEIVVAVADLVFLGSLLLDIVVDECRSVLLLVIEPVVLLRGARAGTLEHDKPAILFKLFRIDVFVLVAILLDLLL